MVLEVTLSITKEPCLWMTGVLLVITNWSNTLVRRRTFYMCIFIMKTTAVWSLDKSLNKHVGHACWQQTVVPLQSGWGARAQVEVNAVSCTLCSAQLWFYFLYFCLSTSHCWALGMIINCAHQVLALTTFMNQRKTTNYLLIKPRRDDNHNSGSYHSTS